MVVRARRDRLYRFRRVGRTVRFYLHISVTRWLTLCEASPGMGDARDALGEIPNFPKAEAHHDIIEALGVLYSPQTLARYFTALYVPETQSTKRTFYAAARLVRYGENSERAYGYVEAGCDAHSEISSSYSLWHFRFREDIQGLPFADGVIGPDAEEDVTFGPGLAGLSESPEEPWEKGEWTPDEFYARLRIPARRFACRRHTSRAGNAVFTYFEYGTSGEMRPVEHLILYAREHLMENQMRRHCLEEIREYARCRQRKMDEDAGRQRDAVQLCAD